MPPRSTPPIALLFFFINLFYRTSCYECYRISTISPKLDFLVFSLLFSRDICMGSLLFAVLALRNLQRLADSCSLSGDKSPDCLLLFESLNISVDQVYVYPFSNTFLAFLTRTLSLILNLGLSTGLCCINFCRTCASFAAVTFLGFVPIVRSKPRRFVKLLHLCSMSDQLVCILRQDRLCIHRLSFRIPYVSLVEYRCRLAISSTPFTWCLS